MNIHEKINNFVKEKCLFETYNECVPILNKFLEEQQEVKDYIHWFRVEDNELLVQYDYSENGQDGQAVLTVSGKAVDLKDVPLLTN